MNQHPSQQEKGISQLEQTLTEILESIPYFVACDSDGRIVYINEQYATELHARREDLIGRPISEVIGNSLLPEVAKTGHDEMGYHRLPAFSAAESIGTICQRRPIYEQGVHREGKITGAMGYTILSNIKQLNELLNEVSVLKDQIKLYRSVISELNQNQNLFPEIIGQSKLIADLKALLIKVAPSNSTVCICGETGTGKELVANAICQLSERAHKPFIKINCAAIPQDLLESELFGYEAGAFTGAARHGKIGKFELADQGTLLLDEVGELPLHLQAKLLRALQEQQIERIGGKKPIQLNVRILCSTNRNLQELVKAGLFRADLYYRLNTFEIYVPPLRDRKEDIELLTDHFIKTINERNRLNVSGYTDAVRTALLHYGWPGNIRELQHTIERACILCEIGKLRPEHFDRKLFPNAVEDNASGNNDNRSLKSRKVECEKNNILEALRVTNGNRSAAAAYLGIHRSSLYRKLQKYQIY